MVGWLACVIYSRFPSFWLMMPTICLSMADATVALSNTGASVDGMWVIAAIITEPWRHVRSIEHDGRDPAAVLFICGFYLYSRSR